VNAVGYILLALVILGVLICFLRGIHAGMGAFLACMVFLPGMLGIELPGSLPQFTVHRILLLIALFFLARGGYLARGERPVTHLRILLLFGFCQVLSFACGVSRVAGLKECVDFAFEAVIFYIMVSAFLRWDGSAPRLLTSLCHGLAAVALLAALQKYLGIGAIPYATPVALIQWLDLSDISSTYPHRILFGYAMAMGAPLALGLAVASPEPGKRRRMLAIAVLLVAGSYFSGSRGPWIGMGLGLAAMGALGGGAVRRRLAVLAALAVAVLVFRPGVRDTITDLASSTVEEGSLKGASYQFRWQLWNVAWSEVRRSPVRFLFGYGPVSTESMDFTHYWDGQEGGGASLEKIGYTSWDNNYAADLIELGVAGFAVRLLLFASIARALLANWRRADPQTRILRGAIAGSCLVFMFAMTNVFIFSPQLKYLFWALVAIGSNPTWNLGELPVAQPAMVADEAAPAAPIETVIS